MFYPKTKHPSQLRRAVIMLGTLNFFSFAYAQSTDTAPATPQAIMSAPSIKADLGTTNSTSVAAPLDGPALQTPEAKANALADDVPWALKADAHPFPLVYKDLVQPNGLLLSLPPPQEVKLLLPGKVSDLIEQTRFKVSKYVSDLMGSAAQARENQMDTLTVWLDRTNQQNATLQPTEPWGLYQFSREARREVENYRKQIELQAGPQLNFVARTVQAAVNEIGFLLNAMPTYETKVAWYNLLVQLKDGINLYQTRVTESDKKIMYAIDQYLVAHPVIARPVGSPPSKPQLIASNTALQNTPTLTANLDVAPQAKKETASSEPQVQTKNDGTSGAIIVGVGSLLMLGGLALKLRKRNTKTAPQV